jgi:hypothetical protein
MIFNQSEAMPKLKILWITFFVLCVNARLIAEHMPPTVSLRAVHGPQDLAELESFLDGQTVLVFAHQDDELLWMLPFWPIARKFFPLCLPCISTNASSYSIIPSWTVL